MNSNYFYDLPEDLQNRIISMRTRTKRDDYIELIDRLNKLSPKELTEECRWRKVKQSFDGSTSAYAKRKSLFNALTAQEVREGRPGSYHRFFSKKTLKC